MRTSAETSSKLPSRHRPEVEAGGQADEDLDDDGGGGDETERRPVDPAGVEVVAQQDGAEQAARPGERVGADAPLQEQQRQPGGVHAPARMSWPDRGVAPLLLLALRRRRLRQILPPGAGSPSAPLATFRMGRNDLELFAVRGLCGERFWRRASGERSARPDGEPVHGAAQAVGQARPSAASRGRGPRR